MLFDEDFLIGLRSDPVIGMRDVCRITLDALQVDSPEWYDSDYEALLEGYALVNSLIDGKLVSVPIDVPQITGSLSDDCSTIVGFLRSVNEYFSIEASKLKVEAMKKKFSTSLGVMFTYEFSQGDLDRVQVLVNELRKSIIESGLFQAEHKQRLLKRLENVQSELHKRVSDLDRLWGLIGDAGVVLGKFGESAKPIVDRIKEIAEIVWQTQSRAEELPSGTPIPLLQDVTQRQSR
jgi:hypothetical protein